MLFKDSGRPLEAGQLIVPELEGMDTNAGLARIGGNQDLYLNLLRRFLDFQCIPDQINEHLAAGDRLAAERLAHNVKGTSAGLGIGAVQSVAAALERALRQGEASQSLMEDFQSILWDFLDRLRLALPPEAEASSGSFRTEDVPGVVAEMDGLLGDFDVAALDLFEANRDLFASLFSVAEFGIFEKQLTNFALAEARATLRERGSL